MKYDVFISYRRAGGQETARIIRDELKMRGFKVFFDVETLREGDFNVQLLDRIRECKDFVLICSPNALDRTIHEDDWVRRELACAIQNRKNIVPVILRGFSFPPAGYLPREIRDVCKFNGVTASHEHFDSFIKKLVGFLKTSQGFWGFLRSARYNGFVAGTLAFIVIVIATGIYFCARNYLEDFDDLEKSVPIETIEPGNIEYEILVSSTASQRVVIYENYQGWDREKSMPIAGKIILSTEMSAGSKYLLKAHGQLYVMQGVRGATNVVVPAKKAIEMAIENNLKFVPLGAYTRTHSLPTGNGFIVDPLR